MNHQGRFGWVFAEFSNAIGFEKEITWNVCELGKKNTSFPEYFHLWVAIDNRIWCRWWGDNAFVADLAQ